MKKSSVCVLKQKDLQTVKTLINLLGKNDRVVETFETENKVFVQINNVDYFGMDSYIVVAVNIDEEHEYYGWIDRYYYDCNILYHQDTLSTEMVRYLQLNIHSNHISGILCG